MIALIINWLYIFIVLYTFGLITCELLNKFNVLSQNLKKTRIDKVLIIGYISFTTVLSIFSLFSPIGLNCYMLVNIVVLFCAYFSFNYWKGILKNVFHDFRTINIPFGKTLFLLSFILIIFLSIQKIWIYDSDFYHLQAIRWIEEYGTVLGLGNLFDRLANNNANFVASAYFNYSLLNLAKFEGLNSFFFCVMIYSWYYMLSKYRGDFRFVIFNIIILVCFYSYRWGISSPSPDILVALLTFYFFQIVCETDFSGIAKQKTLNINFFVMLCLSFFLITVKLSTLPFIIPGVFLTVYFIIKQRHLKVLMIIIPFLIITPWLIRNVMISGYILYPSSIIDVFDFDWKMPKNVVNNRMVTDILWARMGPIKTEIFQASEMLNMNFIEWVPMWFRNNYLIGKILWSLFGFSIVLIPVAISRLVRKKIRSIDLGIFYFWFVSVIASLFVFFTAPSIRFGLAPLVISSAVPIALFVSSLLSMRYIHLFFDGIRSLVIIVLFYFYVLSGHSFAVINKNMLLYPNAYPMAITETKEGVNLSVNTPISGNCGYSELPCSSLDISLVEMRGTNFTSGFRTKLNVEEK